MKKEIRPVITKKSLKAPQHRNRITAAACIFLVLLLFTGCGIRYPKTADDGSAWDESWEMIGPVLGVEMPDPSFSLLENNSVLAGSNIFYASWTTGEATVFTNEEGKDADLYPAQLYVLVQGNNTENDAAATLTDYLAREEAAYAETSLSAATLNGQEYQVLRYTVGSDTNPYERGVTAFTRYGKYAVIAELSCTEEYTENEHALMERMLQCFHYSSDLLR